MRSPISTKRRISSIVLAWLIFIGIDFLFHASLLSAYWTDELPALKPLEELAVLIPAGYFSFLLLVALIAYVFFLVFPQQPPLKKVVRFGLVFALLFALSNGLGLFSYIDLPWQHVVVFNLVYLVEILATALSLYYFAFAEHLKRPVGYAVLIFLGLVVLGIVVQNL